MSNKRNYFETNIQRFGVDFLDYKKVEEIQRDSKFIFRDIVFGNINYEKYGIYFMDPRFLEQLIIVSSIESKKHDIKFRALAEFDNKYPGDQITSQLVCIENGMKVIMETLYNYLSMVKKDNYNIAYLTNIPAILISYKKILRDNY